MRTIRTRPERYSSVRSRRESANESGAQVAATQSAAASTNPITMADASIGVPNCRVLR